MLRLENSIEKLLIIITRIAIITGLTLFVYFLIRYSNAYTLTTQEQNMWSSSIEPLAPYIQNRVNAAINIAWYSLGSFIVAFFFFILKKYIRHQIKEGT